MTDNLWKAVEDATKRLKGIAHKTPVFTCSSLDKATNNSVTLKAENLQLSGSFKFRGAYNALSALVDKEKPKLVVTNSSGNHGQALALAAKMHGVRALIVMPRNAPQVKKEAVLSYGGEIIPCETTQASRNEVTARVMQETSALFVDSHNDLDVIAGQATAAMELIEEKGPLDLLLAPVGGGGLIAGTAIAAKHLLDHVQVIGCEPAGADDAYRSLKTGKRITDFTANTIADGLRTPLGKTNFEIIRQLVDSIVLVSEEEIVQAMRYVWERMKLVIEPSSAVAVAPLLNGKIGGDGQRIGVILSGGNVDLDSFFESISAK
jgi:threonine dehydratase